MWWLAAPALADPVSGHGPGLPECVPACADAEWEALDLRGAPLDRVDLRGARVTADLRGARLEGADLRGADLSGARLARARLDGALADGATRFPARHRAQGVLSLAPGADLDGADLADRDLRG